MDLLLEIALAGRYVLIKQLCAINCIPKKKKKRKKKEKSPPYMVKFKTYNSLFP